MIYKNITSQKLAVYAYTASTGAAKTGDAANITAFLSKDWGAAAAITDTNPTELDAVNMPGWYVFDLAQAETDAEVLIVAPQSATAGVVLDQVQVFTLDATISSRASQSSVDDVPTVAELNARTLPSADYFDPATDTVANVTTVGSVTNGVTVATNNDKTGYALTAAYDAAKTAAQAGDEMDLVDAPNATAIAAFQAGLALAATALSNATWTDGRAALLDYLDAAITSRLASADYTAPDNAGITTGITSLLDRLTALRAGYLDKLNVTGTLAHSDAANTYKADVSGLATGAEIAALDLLIDAIKAQTDLLPADPAGVSNIPDISALALEATAQAVKERTDNLPPDPVGVSDLPDVSGLATEATVQAIRERTDRLPDDPMGLSDLVDLEDDVAAIKAQTDSLMFTVPGKVDATAEAVIDTEAIADAVADVVGDTVAGDVWSHSPRTLTQIGVAPGTTTTAETISRRRGDSWEIAISGLAMEGWQELWFTVKRGYEYADPNALLQITLTGGLVRLNGAAAEAGDAALAITGTHDAATITVRAEATAQLPTGTFVYDLQWMDSAGDIHTVSLGTFTVSSDVTRATS